MPIILREIREDDLEMIMHWRMDPDITRYMNTNPQLTMEKQKKWLKSVCADSSVQYWMIEKDETPIGVINLADIDFEKKCSSWGYYIGDKRNRSLKTAISLEMSLYDYVFDVLDFDELHNEAFSINEGVVKLHLACGSRIVKQVPGEVEKEGILYEVTHLSITKETWHAIRNTKKYEQINFSENFELHHVGYAVENISAAIAEYRKLGYYQTSNIVVDNDRSVKIVFMKSYDGKQTVELVAPIGGQTPVSQILKNKKNVSSPYHICYMVNDIEKMTDYLKMQGYILTTALKPAVALGNRRVIFLMKKEVGLIELVEQ